MSGFSPEWLALREPVDHRARDAGLARALARRLDGIAPLRVVDLGAGTGSNLRALAPILGPHQVWTLVDDDPDLAVEAVRRLTLWADTAEPDGAGLRLTKAGRTLAVAVRRADLVTGFEPILAEGCDLVTASALFDLTSAAWMNRLAAAVVASGAAFHAALTYDGRDAFDPPHRLDDGVVAAFAAHMRRDKGFGPAAGADATDGLAAAFGRVGRIA